jgi:hypothetical protein
VILFFALFAKMVWVSFLKKDIFNYKMRMALKSDLCASTEGNHAIKALINIPINKFF